MRVALKGISVSFPDWKMEGLALETPAGSFVSIVGPSGCGKTTLLRVIAGLQEISTGKVLLGGNDVTSFPPEERNVGLVFQGESLFPHMNVFENVAFGARMKKLGDIEKRVNRALKLVHMEGFGARGVGNLSGGERKRVAIARAICFEPAVLLLDEPLNGLDAPLKEKMKSFLQELRQKTGLTMVMVTHDIDEAFFLSDMVAVMSSGKIEQFADPIEIFRKPKSGFVESFLSDYEIVKRSGKSVALIKRRNCRPAG